MEAVETTMYRLRQLQIPCVAAESLRKHTSFEIGGPAAIFVTPGSISQLKSAIQCGRENGLTIFYLGHGSNVLFRDAGYAGMVIHLTDALAGIELDETNQITAGAGVALADVCRVAQQSSLTGIEFAYGIPGSVGGAIFMDAGAFGGDMKQVVRSVTYLDENLQEITAPVEELDLAYRQSVFHNHPWCILSATFQLAPGDDAAILQEMEQFMIQRAQKQPLELPSAGSAFKRPEGAFAGALIDECGLRGFRVGDAAISEKHCGFIVNLGNATSEDVIALATQVADIVYEKTGYVLEKEIMVVEETKE